jgi:hypothetical protein
MNEIQSLQAAIASHLATLRDRMVKAGAGLDDMVEVVGRDGSSVVLHGVDALAAEYLAGLEQEHIADEWRSEAGARAEIFAGTQDGQALLAPWLPAAGVVPDIVGSLAPTVWSRFVLPDLDSARRSGAPAISAAVLDQAQRACWSPGRSLRGDGGDQIVINQKGGIVASICSTEYAMGVPADLVRGLRAINKLTGHRLVRWLVESGHRQSLDQTTRDPRRIRIDGGFTALAAELGLTYRKASHELRSILGFLQHAHLKLPLGEVAGLVMWSTEPAAPGRPERLTIVLSDALMPGYVTHLPRGGASKRRARMLVPVPLQMPRLIGHQRHHAALALLQFLVLREMRFRAAEFVKSGGVRLPRGTWLDLAQEADVPLDLVDSVVTAWADPGDPGAFLQRLETPEVFSLGPAFIRESLALEGAGHKQQWGREYQLRTRWAREQQQRNRRRT